MTAIYHLYHLFVFVKAFLTLEREPRANNGRAQGAQASWPGKAAPPTGPGHFGLAEGFQRAGPQPKWRPITNTDFSYV